MSTQNWSDDDLDDFFRKSAKEADPTNDPVAWRGLEARLNQRDRPTASVRSNRTGWGVPLLIVAFITGSIIGYNQFPLADEINQTGNKGPTNAIVKTDAVIPGGQKPNGPAEVTNRPADELTGIDTSVQYTTTEPSIRSDGPDDAKDRVAQLAVRKRKSTNSGQLLPVTKMKPTSDIVYGRPDSDVTGSPRAEPSGMTAGINPLAIRADRPLKRGLLPPEKNRRMRSIRLTSRAGQPTEPVPGRARSIRNQYTEASLATNDKPIVNATSSSSPALDVEALDKAAFTAYQKGQPSDSTRLAWPTPATLPAKDVTWPALPLPDRKVALLDAQENNPGLTRLIRNRPVGLSIQAVLSPDLSSVGLHSFDRPGSNFGVMVQYQILPRLSVQTGALWSTKLYNASVADYVWPPEAKAHVTVLPESVMAKCMMIDVPLNLRYDVFQRPSGSKWGPARWFVSAGATSYYLNREVYEYQFANPDDPAIGSRQYDNKALGRKGGHFVFSNINLSVGYERPVSRHLSWQVEPFMKIPVKQVGYFNVNLLSTGAFVSLRYHL